MNTFASKIKKITLRQILKAIAGLLLILFLLVGPARNAASQSGGLNVKITKIDARAFPQVTAYVTVTDNAGLPVTGLTAEDFAIFEDGLELVSSEVTVESVTIRGRYLVLALDPSTYNDVLPKVQAAAKAFVRRLTPEDRLALLAFYDEVEVLADFTNNTQVLEAAIDSLTLRGNYTTLNRMVFEAASLVEAFPPGQKALIILPDSKNNIGPGSPDDAIAQVQRVETPLYLIGVKTEKIRLENLEPFAAQTVGQVAVVEPDDLQAALLAIADRLPQGYRVTYRSALEADNRSHSLSVLANHQSGSAQDEGRFVALPGQVIVSLPNLSEGQTVGGIVTLTAQVESPAPPAEVEYLLDGQMLGRVNVPPYNLRWDSTTVGLGSHTITARAADIAGNQGQTAVNLTVAPPVNVSISAPQSEVALGEEVDIQAKIEAFTPLAQVDLLVDGQVVSGHTAPPYNFSFDNTQYGTGPRVITVRARDALGQVGEDSLTMEFLPAWKERLRNWLGIKDRATFERWLEFARQAAIVIGALLAILLLIVLAMLLLRKIRQAQANFSRQKFGLAILNLGNTSSQYQLWAETPANALQFGFFLNGDDLQLQTKEVVETVSSPQRAQPDEAAEEYETTETLAKHQTRQANEPEPSPQSGKAKTGSPGPQMGEAAGKARKAMGFSGEIAGMLLSVAKILPRPLGRPLQQAANQMRMGKSRVQLTMRTPKQIAMVSRRVKGQAGSMISSKSRSQSKPASTSTARPAASTTTSAVSASSSTRPAPAVTDTAPAHRDVNGRETVAARTTTRTITARLERALTPEIAPGDALTVDVIINPVDPEKKRSYSFNVISQPVEQPEAPPVVEEGIVHVTRISWFQRYLPVFVIMLVTVFLILDIIIFALWLLGINVLV